MRPTGRLRSARQVAASANQDRFCAVATGLAACAPRPPAVPVWTPLRRLFDPPQPLAVARTPLGTGSASADRTARGPSCDLAAPGRCASAASAPRGARRRSAGSGLRRSTRACHFSALAHQGLQAPLNFCTARNRCLAGLSPIQGSADAASGWPSYAGVSGLFQRRQPRPGSPQGARDVAASASAPGRERPRALKPPVLIPRASHLSRGARAAAMIEAVLTATVKARCDWSRPRSCRAP